MRTRRLPLAVTLGVLSGTARFEPVDDPRPYDRVWPELVWPVAPDVRLTGDTVELSRLDPDRDAADLYRALNDPRVWAHLPFTPESETHYRTVLARMVTRSDRCTFTVRLTRTLGGLAPHTVVGTTSYLDAHVADAWVEIGATAYDPRVWATSVNPECKLLLFAHAFDELGAGRVQLKTDVRNVRSQQAIARLGARFEGVARRHYRRSDGTVRDSVMFAVTAEDWPEVRGGLQARLASDQG